MIFSMAPEVAGRAEDDPHQAAELSGTAARQWLLSLWLGMGEVYSAFSALFLKPECDAGPIPYSSLQS